MMEGKREGKRKEKRLKRLENGNCFLLDRTKQRLRVCGGDVGSRWDDFREWGCEEGFYIFNPRRWEEHIYSALFKHSKKKRKRGGKSRM